MADEPKATAADVIATLRSIDSSLKLLVKHFGIGAQGPSQSFSGHGTVPAMASDADLDGRYGNPEVKAKPPRDWTGDDPKGKRFSECPAAYLDLVASRLDYFAEQNAASEDEAERKKARYNRLDASRARGWAARIRGGYVAPAQDEAAFPSDAPLDPMDSGSVPF